MIAFKDFLSENGEISGTRVGALLGYLGGISFFLLFLIVTIIEYLRFTSGHTPWPAYQTFAQYTVGISFGSGSIGGIMQFGNKALNNTFGSPKGQPFIKNPGGMNQ